MPIGTSVALVLSGIVFFVNLAQSAQKPVAIGVWGGKGIQLTVTTKGATIIYDCGVGTIDEPLRTDPSKRFVAGGTHTFGRGGPRGPGAASRTSHHTRYQGVIDNDVMQLTVSLTDPERKVGEFTLELGRRAALDRCG